MMKSRPGQSVQTFRAFHTQISEQKISRGEVGVQYCQEYAEYLSTRQQEMIMALFMMPFSHRLSNSSIAMDPAKARGC
jgi:hypothetical protein